MAIGRDLIAATRAESRPGSMDQADEGETVRAYIAACMASARRTGLGGRWSTHCQLPQRPSRTRFRYNPDILQPGGDGCRRTISDPAAVIRRSWRHSRGARKGAAHESSTSMPPRAAGIPGLARQLPYVAPHPWRCVNTSCSPDGGDLFAVPLKGSVMAQGQRRPDHVICRHRGWAVDLDLVRTQIADVVGTAVLRFLPANSFCGCFDR